MMLKLEKLGFKNRSIKFTHIFMQSELYNLNSVIMWIFFRL